MNPEDNSLRSVRIRPRAIADIENHADYLEEHAPPEIARRFRLSVMSAVDQISRTPSAGAPRDVHNILLPGLRMWIVPEFRNYLVFYITPTGAIEIVRVFHGAQDINSILSVEDDD